MKQHLIKRKKGDTGFKVREGWYCEISKKRAPSGSKATQGERLYIAQNGYAVFAQGEIVDTAKYSFSCFLDFSRYALKDSRVDDPMYWLSKLRDYIDISSGEQIHVFEYKLENIEYFDVAIPLEERFLKQSAWYYLEEDFVLKIPEVSSTLTAHIPTKIREEVYHRFKIRSSEFNIDIDHFVPASLGGPGNIIENLIPISSSINRRKGNRVPSKLFDFGRKFEIPVPNLLEVKHDRFYGSKEHLSLAKKIIGRLNSQEEFQIREDYKSIRDFHFPSLKDA